MTRVVRMALGGLAALVAFAGSEAWAQDKKPDQPQQPPPDRGDVSVPRGAGGAVLKPQDDVGPGAKPGQATLPRPLNYVPPKHPPEAAKAGLEATVTLQLDIDKNGKVTNATVVDPAGHGFDEAALEAARQLEFAPATRADGTPVAARILYRYSFTLEPAEPEQRPAEQALAPVLSGRVLTAEGDVPLANAEVVIVTPSGERRVSTDAEGKFSFEDLAPGKYRVRIAAPGYEGLAVEEELVAGQATEVKYRLLAQGGGLEVTVRGARPPREVVKRTLERREIDRIPGTNGDALRSIQSLPGVARPPALLGVLIVRGSAPQDTQTFIDGTFVPLIYHFGGLSSVVPTEMIDKIDFYPGNFSAQYGRVMGGIVDVGLRPPKNDGYHGLVQADLIDARLMFEGPIPLLKDWSFAFAGRRSYVDAWAGPVLEEAGAGVTQAPVYYDYQFMVHTDPTPKSSLDLRFFGSDDALEILLKEPAPNEPALSGNVGLHTAFQRWQTRWVHDLTDDTKLTAVAAVGRDKIDFGLGPFYFLLDFTSISGRAELSHRLGRGVTLSYGGDVLFGFYDVGVRAPAPPRPGEPPNGPFSTRAIRESRFEGATSLPAAYVEAELAPTARTKLVPGVRFDYFDESERFDVSPRVNGRYDIVHGYPRTTLKGGVGLFHQPPQFQEVVPPLGTPGVKSARAIQYGAGFEQELSRQIELSVDGFFKHLDQLVTATPSETGASLVYDNLGTGYVIGSEVLLKYKPDARFFGWLAYTLSRSARVDRPGEEERLAPWDQTHILTVLGSYRLGHGWEFGARFRLVSGNNLTPFVCNPSSSDCDLDRTNALFHAASGVYVPIPLTQPGGERMPLFHQLDVRLDKRWKFARWQLSAYLDLQNVYNHANSEAIQYNFNYTGRQFVSGLPILPSIGIRGDF